MASISTTLTIDDEMMKVFVFCVCVCFFFSLSVAPFSSVVFPQGDHPEADRYLGDPFAGVCRTASLLVPVHQVRAWYPGNVSLGDNTYLVPFSSKTAFRSTPHRLFFFFLFLVLAGIVVL